MGVCSGKSMLSYESSPRIRPRQEEPTLAYVNKLARIVDSVSALETEMTRSPLEEYMIERIREWFDEQPEERQPKKPAVIVKLEFLQRRIKPKAKALEFRQLANRQELHQLLKCFERDFCVTDNLSSIITEFQQSKDKRHKFYNGNTIRKEQIFHNYKLDDPEQALIIYEKIACSLYASFLRKQLAGENQQVNSLITQFHEKFGLKLFNFLKYKKITADQLLIVIYHLLIVNSSRLKYEQRQPLVKDSMGRVRDQFQRMFMEEEYTYTMPEQELRNVRAIASSYLDNLYRKSEAQIDNPAINDLEQSVRPFFIFPINTVKSRHKKY